MMKTIYRLSVILMFISSAFVGVIVYWLVYPYQVISFAKTPLPVLNENHEVKRGEAILFRGDHTNLTDGILVGISSQIVCKGFTLNLPDAAYISRKGEFNRINGTTVIPSTFPDEEECHLTIINRFPVNPLRVVLIEVMTEDFKVIP